MNMLVTQQTAMLTAATLHGLNSATGGKHLDYAALTKALRDAPDDKIKPETDGTFTVAGGMNVQVNGDGSMSLRLATGVGEWTVTLTDVDENGEYTVTSNDLNSKSLTGAQEAAFEREFSNIMENLNVYGGTKKKKGGTTGGSGGAGSGDNWFIQMAEALGEMLNQMANDVKTATNNVKTRDGQAPFKDSMRIQGLAQQLGFMSNAFMTTLNSIGEAIKTTVTAGGAAR